MLASTPTVLRGQLDTREVLFDQECFLLFPREVDGSVVQFKFWPHAWVKSYQIAWNLLVRNP